MPQSMHSSKKRARLCDKTSGKCGEITFCLQVGTRVYALNCLFCSQICIQWDAFINHMEEEHVQELRSDHLLQQEIEEVNVDANNSKETAPKQSSAHMLEELPQSSQMCIRTELNNGASTQPILDYNDPLGGNSATKCASITATVKTEDYHFVPDLSYECRVDAAASDQTCDSINEQSHYCTMPFNNANILGSEERCANHNSIPDIHHMMANNLRTVEDTNKELKELKEDFSQFKYESEKMHSRLLTEIQLLQNQGSIRPKVCGILPNKPMETGDDFNKFEKTIQESSQKAMELAEELKTYVISDPSKFVRTILKKLLTNELAAAFSWRGTKSKQALKHLTTTAVIRGVCAEKFNMNEKEFEFTFARWFQTATDRLNYQKRTEKV